MTQRFRIEFDTLQQLRQLFLQSLEIQREVGGILSSRMLVDDDQTENGEKHKRKVVVVNDDDSERVEDENILLLELPTDEVANRKVGTQHKEYTLCEVHDDVPYTFHCHPIEVDIKSQLPINISNLISSEDMIGVVQDHVSNNGYLSNCNGKLEFDILLCPLGLFVSSATEVIINKWIELEDEIVVDKHSKKLMKKLSSTKTEVDDSNFVNQLKHLIHTTLNDDNPFWASEENALMNNGFNEYVGSWYYLNRGEGFFAKEILTKFKYLGYQYWWKKQVFSIEKKTKKAAQVQEICEVENLETMKYLAESLPLNKQLDWFKSTEFLSIDYSKHKLLQDYLTEMRTFGFYIQFFNWNSERIDFVFVK
ncbi:hypothetical protein C9374_008979 [Naegleria lovaniensis]|uniref:Uncharacterized protein n=1 Tax=Naegleria lovaniensis TaxID=51637 RepID=A0AA88KKK2_NAELO|nr:uncharacterized protein C9374_008979 [Naegleria lovaniensis]KAG2377894.1 hypothetical protein C9374_008979 [Naegleria lovaniensis]